jgi:protein-disulfide isomerase
MTAMNTKRIIFWLGFVIVLGLIIWGLIVAMNREGGVTPKLEAPSPVTLADHVRGPAEAPVTIIEYSDFQCPACATYYPIVERLVTEASTTVRFVYRHFPLYPIPHKNAVVAAEASEAAAMQGKFWEMYRLLFENQKLWENSDTAAAVFEEYAGRIGLNLEVYKKDVVSDVVKARVEKDRAEGVALGVNSTPTFFVNGTAVVNPNSYESFKELIETAAKAGTN